MKAIVLSRSAVGAEAWNGLVERSPEGCPWARYEWQDEICAISEWRLSDVGFGLQQDGQLLGVVPLHVSSRRRRVLSSSGFGPSGPVLRADLGPAHRSRLWREAFEQMRAIAVEQNCERISVATSAVTDAALGNRWGVSPFFAWGMTDESTCTSVIDLSVSEEALWNGLATDARTNIRRAERTGVRVDEVSWKDRLDDYYAMHVETYRRTGATPHPRRYFEAIARQSERGYYRLWMASDRIGDPIAFHNAVQFRAGAQYNTGCSSERALEAGANYLLAWTAILASRDAGKAWFDMGEVAAEGADVKSRALAVFKRKFGGELHRFFRGSYEVSRQQAVALRPSWLQRGVSRALTFRFPTVRGGQP